MYIFFFYIFKNKRVWYELSYTTCVLYLFRSENIIIIFIFQNETSEGSWCLTEDLSSRKDVRANKPRGFVSIFEVASGSHTTRRSVRENGTREKRRNTVDF